jgi:hypothetical protein
VLNIADVAWVYAKTTCKLTLRNMMLKSADFIHIGLKKTRTVIGFVTMIFASNGLNVIGIYAGWIVANMMKNVSFWYGAKSLLPKVSVSDDLLTANVKPAISIWSSRTGPNPTASGFFDLKSEASLMYSAAGAGAELAIGMLSGEVKSASRTRKVVGHG